MAYALGIDLGTTSSAAAVNDGTGVRMLSVDHSAAVVPSVVHLDGDGTILVGAGAERRAISDPSGVAREFKRRFGDPQPLILSGAPVSANDLMLEMARALVNTATKQLGEAPSLLVVCHPANWGNYKVGLLSDLLDNSELPPHRLVTEPEAAAIHYASQERVGDGEVIAVYDLGGGTFDAVVLRKTEARESGWELLGEPRGIERLGGIDFDAAVLHHVVDALSLDLDQYDSDDAANQTAMVRFRAECREAKHALSSDVTATVPVLLPGYNETVRITRRELEALIDPAIGRTIDTLEVAVSTTGLGMDDIDRILLVGGSTRVPLVAARLSEATNRPIKSDAHPKHAVALGAAELAGLGAPSVAATSTETPPPASSDVAPPKAPAPSHTDLYNLPHIDEEPLPEFMQSRPTAPRPPEPPSQPVQPIQPAASTPPSMDTAPTEATPAVSGQQPATPVGPVIVDEPKQRRRSPVVPFLASFLVVAALLTAGLLLFAGGDDSATPDPEPTTSTTTEATATSAPDPVVESSCSANQFPDPDVVYRVSEIPDTFDEATLNGRNVPSTTAVNGVASRPITAFPEFSELDLTYTDCEVAENGRVWWGVNYTGPDVAGGTYSGLVWSSTRFIEPVPG